MHDMTDVIQRSIKSIIAHFVDQYYAMQSYDVEPINSLYKQSVIAQVNVVTCFLLR